MSKRSTPLSNYDWDAYMSNAPPPSKRRALSGDEDEAEQEEEEEEEETVNIDEGVVRQAPARTQQEQGLSILNAMPVKGGAKGKAAATEEEVPSVYLDDYYTSLYNPYMSKRFPPSEYGGGSDEEGEAEHDTDDDLFSSLARSGDDSSPVNAAVASINAAAKSYAARRRKEAPHYDTQKRGECFLCAFGNRFHDGVKAKKVNRLFDIMDGYGMCHNIELAQQLELYFKENVYKPGQGMTMLTKEIALEHIEGMHTLSAIIFIGESIKTWMKVFFNSANTLYKANGKIDKEASILMRDSQKMLNELYKMDPSKLNFNFGKSRDDTNKLGAPFRIMPEFKQKKEKDKRAKKTNQLRSANQVFKRGLDV